MIFYREGERWLAQSVQPEVATFGDTLEEAKAAIREALELYFEDQPLTEQAGEVLLETVLV